MGQPIISGGRKTLLEDHVPDDAGDLKRLILEIASLAVRIRSGFIENQGVAGTQNMYGETQVEMDKWADEVLVDGLSRLPYVASVGSEERDSIIEINENGEFSVVFDPLDGSSLMGVNLTVGTIVGIFRSKTPFHKGKQLAGALYVLYGPLTTLVYSIGQGVHEFAFDKKGNPILQKEDLKIGDKKIFAPGGLRKEYSKPHFRFISELERRGYKLRFAGAFVADVHQILHKGGVFTYPATSSSPQGKLRLLFEAIPMGYLVKQAGGSISDGRGDILEILPEKIDQRVPVYVGGNREIEIVQKEFMEE